MDTEKSSFTRFRGVFWGLKRLGALVAAAALLWAFLCLVIAAAAPKAVEDVVRFRTLVDVFEPKDADEVVETNDRSLVLVRGTTSSPDMVCDPKRPDFATNALALVRSVEMFQWVEKPAEGTPGVRYEGAWKGEVVDSSKFAVAAGHENPRAMPTGWAAQEFPAASVRVGAYLVVPKARVRAAVAAAAVRADCAYIRAESGAFFDAATEAPEVGDLRVSWSVIPHAEVSIVAAQRSDKVPRALAALENPPRAALMAQEGGAVSEKLFLCEQGAKSAEELFAPFRKTHALPDWLLWRAHVFATRFVSPSTLGQLVGGLLVSMALFVLTLSFSLPLGLGVAFARMSASPVIAGAARFYISAVRGTPLMLQLLFVYFGPYYIFGLSLSKYPAFVAAVIAFSVNYAAYFAEIYRSGIESIPIGQHEAAKMLGFTKRDAFVRIVLPQVVKRILPPVTNEVITLVKDTSLAQVISVVEMFTIAKQLGNAQTSIAPLVVAGVFYYIFNGLVAFAMEKAEKALSYYK